MNRLKPLFARIFAGFVMPRVYKDCSNAVQIQSLLLMSLVKKAAGTQFGKNHGFDSIKDHECFKKNVPVRDYEGIKGYIDQVVQGRSDVLWPGVPIYLSKTSGTTSGVKFIPITKESMPHHIKAARNALLSYIFHTGKSDFTKHKMIFLQGSPILDHSGPIPSGRLSGIVAHYVPGYLQRNRMPSFVTNCIEDWEHKVDAIVKETLEENMSVISGIPSWVQMYFEKLVLKTGRRIGEIFPDFSLFVYGGVNFEPYRERFNHLIGRKVDSIELYPASEGFIAWQDDPKDKGLLLNINAGIFYEFVPVAEINDENPRRLTLAEVQPGENYAIILTTNAGLWAYNIGDTVKFTSLDPYRIRVTGRIRHFTSAFGEHVISEEVEQAMEEAIRQSEALVTEFTVAPQTSPIEGLPYHEWFIEFEREPADWDKFIRVLDETLQKKNTYYKDLIKGHVLRRLVVTVLRKGAFVNLMKSQGKLGGQNKIPKLQNDRMVADILSRWTVRSIL